MTYLCTSEPIKVRSTYVPKGYAGTLATAGHMVRLILAGAKDLRVRATAIAIYRAHGIAAKDYLGEMAALFSWVRRNVRYTRDIHRVELLHTPRRMLELRAGDCDDMAILLAAMLESTGHPTRLVLVGSNPKRRDRFSHVYVEALHRGRWIALDPTMDRPMGWAPRAATRKVVPVHVMGRTPRARSSRHG